MKKHLLRSLALIITAGFAISFVACSDNEDEEKHIGGSAELTGIWDLTHIKGYEKENGVTTINIDQGIPSELSGIAYIQFYRDRTFSSPFLEEDDMGEGEWTLSGDKLTLTSYNPYYDELFEIVFTFDMLTDKKLVVYSSEDFTEDGIHYQSYMRLVAVKR